MAFSKISEATGYAPPAVDWNDVQALVRSSFAGHKASLFVPFQFGAATNATLAAWLDGLTARITRAEAPSDLDAAAAEARRHARAPTALNIIFSAQGVARLSGSHSAPVSFNLAFREGIAPRPTPHDPAPRRSIYLGDTGTNDPAHWLWRDTGDDGARIDGMLLLYATDTGLLAKVKDSELAHLAANGLRLATDSSGRALMLDGQLIENASEPFGFKDGIAQPILDCDRRDRRETRARSRGRRVSELGRRAVEQSIVRTGEMLLGYTNERGAVAGQIGTTLEPHLKNGTYVVIRELHQDVAALDAYVARAADAHFGNAAQLQRDWIKERMVGRRVNGAMLTATDDVPANGKATRSADEFPNEGTLNNDLLHHPSDRFGLACPLGSHVRRANPRDSLGPDPGTALRLGKMHRIARRSRLIMGRATQGIYFVALNADIGGQFEHIQQNWINNDRFMGLNGEIDPISHYRPYGTTQMTIQRRPFNIRLKDIPQFVTVRGGGYFFLPGLAALALYARDLARPAA